MKYMLENPPEKTNPPKRGIPKVVGKMKEDPDLRQPPVKEKVSRIGLKIKLWAWKAFGISASYTRYEEKD